MDNRESFIKQTAEFLVNNGLCSEENATAYATDIYYNAAECFADDDSDEN